MTDQGVEPGSGASRIIAALEERGCEHVFVLPGSSMVSVLNGLQWSSLTPVHALHEPAAISIADGYSRLRGLTPLLLYMAPGTANAMANLYNARCDDSPLLVLASQQSEVNRSGLNTTVGELDLARLVEPVSRYSWEVRSGEQLGQSMRLAMRHALGPPSGPAVLALPQDVLEQPAAPFTAYVAPGRRASAPNDIGPVVERLRAARRPVIVVGGGVQRTGGEQALAELAELLEAPVFYEPFWNDRLSIAPYHRLAFGELTPRSSVAADADVALVVGARMFHEIHPRTDPWFGPDCFVVHVAQDHRRLEDQWAADWSCATDPTLFLTAVRDALRMEGLDHEVLGERRSYIEAAAVRRASRGNTEQRQIVSALAGALNVGYVVDESVTVNNDLVASFSAGPAAHYISTTGGSLGWATGAAAGVAIASGQPVTCVIGDGSFFFGLQSLWNAVVGSLPIVFVVFDNEGFGSTRYFEDLFVGRLPAGERKRAGYLGSDFRGTRPPIANVARSFGLDVWDLKDAADLHDTYARVVAGLDRPALIVVPIPF